MSHPVMLCEDTQSHSKAAIPLNMGDILELYSMCPLYCQPNDDL